MVSLFLLMNDGFKWPTVAMARAKGPRQAV
jgi:hypothetical protein